ncbi:hypothetical protein [Roseicyclus sp.]
MPRRHAGVGALPTVASLATGAATAQEVATTYEDAWISLGGTVEAVRSTSFLLDYGDNDITVELDRFDWSIDRAALEGRYVNVTGRMDRNFGDTRSIEAATVHVPALNDYIYADPADEEGDPSVVRSFLPGAFPATASDGAFLAVSGRVTEVGTAAIIIDIGTSPLRVDTRLIPGAPDAPPVEVGDHVVVTGRMDADRLPDRREIEASTITRLTDASR